MSKVKFWTRVLLACVATAVASVEVRAQEPSIKTILNNLYSGATITLLSSSGNVNINSGSTFDNMISSQSVKTTSAAQQWITPGGGNGSFDLQTKYAGNNTTFGFFNPPSSTQATAPGLADFKAIFTSQGSGYDTGALTVNSHLVGTATLGQGQTAGSQAGFTATGELKNTGGISNTGPVRVTNLVNPFAFGIRSPVTVGGSSVNINNAPQFSSVNTQNSDGYRHMLSFQVTTTGPSAATFYVIAFEDLAQGSADWDYNDLVVELAPVGGRPSLEPTPEPVTLAMFGVGFVGLAGYRLRQRRKTTTEVVA